MIHDGVVVAEKIRKLRTEGGVDGGGEGRLEFSGKGDVCKGNTLRCKVRASSKVLFEDKESRTQAVLKNVVDLGKRLRRKKP